MKKHAIILSCLLFAACRIQEAQAAVNINLTYIGSDSVKVTIWPTISVPVDSFVYKITGAATLDTTVSAKTPAISLTLANVSAERQLTISVWSKRKHVISESAATKQFTIPAVIIPPPAPDSIIIKLDSVTAASLFEEPDSLSPHFSFISRTYTDFCYCWNGSVGQAAKVYAAKLYDLVMSGDRDSWKNLNPNMTWLRYNLVVSTLDEANNDPNSITGKWQDDMRKWYSAKGYADSVYENAWLHAANATTRDSASRLNPFIWSTKRFFGNPRDSIFTAYTRSRLLRGLNGDGFFFDEMDHNNLKYFQQSAEFAGLDTIQTHAIFTNWIASLGNYLDSATGRSIMIQTNAAGYSDKQWDKAIGIAAGSMHLELMNLATQSQYKTWEFIDELLAKGTYVDFVGAETWQDMLNPKWLTKYPGGNYALPVYRAKVAQLASYYMVVPSDPQKIGLQIENDRNTVRPDSTDLKIYHFNVGHPKEARRVLVTASDPVGQVAKVWARQFDNALVLYRAVNSYKDSVSMADPSAFPVTIPELDTYYLVRANGDFATLPEGLKLRNGEAAILVKKELVH